MNDLYNEIITSIQFKIINEYDSVKSFCDKNNISRYNLSRVFNGKSKLSMGLFMKIINALKMLSTESNIELKRDDSIILYDYLTINHDFIQKAIYKLLI